MVRKVECEAEVGQLEFRILGHDSKHKKFFYSSGR